MLQVHHQLPRLHVEGILQPLTRHGAGTDRRAPRPRGGVEVPLRDDGEPQVRQREPLRQPLGQQPHLRVRRQLMRQQLARGGALHADDRRAAPLAGLGVEVGQQVLAQAGVEVGVVRAAAAGQVAHAADRLGHQRHGRHAPAQGLARPAEPPAQGLGLRGEPLGVGLPLGDERELRERGLHARRVLHPQRRAPQLRQQLGRLQLGRGRGRQGRGRGRQGQRRHLRHGALRGRVEGAQAVHRVAEEFRAHGLRRPRGPDVEDAAAQGEGQRLGHQLLARVAHPRERLGQRVEREILAQAQGLAHRVQRLGVGHRLQQGMDGGHHEPPPLRRQDVAHLRHPPARQERLLVVRRRQRQHPHPRQQRRRVRQRLIRRLGRRRHQHRRPLAQQARGHHRHRHRHVPHRENPRLPREDSLQQPRDLRRHLRQPFHPR